MSAARDIPPDLEILAHISQKFTAKGGEEEENHGRLYARIPEENLVTFAGSFVFVEGTKEWDITFSSSSTRSRANQNNRSFFPRERFTYSRSSYVTESQGRSSSACTYMYIRGVIYAGRWEEMRRKKCVYLTPPGRRTHRLFIAMSRPMLALRLRRGPDATNQTLSLSVPR